VGISSVAALEAVAVGYFCIYKYASLMVLSSICRSSW